MASNPEAKYPHVLLGMYDKLYFERYDKKPKYNKFREKWAMQDVIDSVGLDRAKELLLYYFKVTKPGHPLSWFFYNFDKLDDMLNQSELDKMKRQKLLEQTKKMVEDNEYRSSSN